jgi:hypothetical protein
MAAIPKRKKELMFYNGFPVRFLKSQKKNKGDKVDDGLKNRLER